MRALTTSLKVDGKKRQSAAEALADTVAQLEAENSRLLQVH